MCAGFVKICKKKNKKNIFNYFLYTGLIAIWNYNAPSLLYLNLFLIKLFIYTYQVNVSKKQIVINKILPKKSVQI